MMDPVLLYYGKGQLSGFLADPNGVLDVVSRLFANPELVSLIDQLCFNIICHDKGLLSRFQQIWSLTPF